MFDELDFNSYFFSKAESSTIIPNTKFSKNESSSSLDFAAHKSNIF